jgi:hypothetical protein
MTIEARINEPGGDVGQQTETRERGLSIEPRDEVVGDPHALERAGEHELVRVQDEGAAVFDLDELGEILLRLLGIDERRGVVAEHAEVAVDAQVDRRRLNAVFQQRIDHDATGGELLANRDVRQDHDAGAYGPFRLVRRLRG